MLPGAASNCSEQVRAFGSVANDLLLLLQLTVSKNYEKS